MVSAAVVGGGIGGLTAALCLHARGHHVHVFEQTDAFGEVGAGLQIGPNGMRVLTRLGLAEAVLDRASRPEGVLMRNGLSGRVVVRIPFGAQAQGRYGQPYIQIHRADLLEVLADAARTAGIEVTFGRTVTDASELPAHDMVVGADGIRSHLRHGLCPDVSPSFTGQVAWRGTIAADVAPEGLAPDHTHLFMGPGHHVVAYPLRNGRIWNIVAVEERNAWAEEGWHTAADIGDIRKAFAGWNPLVTGLVGAIDHAFLWGLFAHGPLPRWQDGRVALLGDACHPMLPFLAQGATMAIEDAWVLAEMVDSHPEVPAALAAYEAARLPRASRVQAAAARNAQVYHMRSAPGRWGMHMILRWLARPGGVGLLRKLDWLYGGDVTTHQPG